MVLKKHTKKTCFHFVPKKKNPGFQPAEKKITLFSGRRKKKKKKTVSPKITQAPPPPPPPPHENQMGHP